VADLAHGGAPRVGPLTYKDLFELGQPPDSVVVLIAAYGGGRFPLFAASHQPRFIINVGDNAQIDHYGYLLTFSIGHLTLQVVGHHINWAADLRPTAWKRDVARIIWPQPDSVRWPPPVPLDNDAFLRFMRTL